MFQLPFHTGPEGRCRTKTYLSATLVPSNLSARVEPRKSPSLRVRRRRCWWLLRFSFLPFLLIFSNPICDNSDTSWRQTAGEFVTIAFESADGSCRYDTHALVLRLQRLFATDSTWDDRYRRESRRVFRTDFRRAVWRPRDVETSGHVNFFVGRACVSVTPLKFEHENTATHCHSATSIVTDIPWARTCALALAYNTMRDSLTDIACFGVWTVPSEILFRPFIADLSL